MMNNRTPGDVTKTPPPLPISDLKRYAMLTIFSGVMGSMEMWLWKVGYTDQYGVYFGIVFIAGTLYSARQYINCRKKIE